METLHEFRHIMDMQAQERAAAYARAAVLVAGLASLVFLVGFVDYSAVEIRDLLTRIYLGYFAMQFFIAVRLNLKWYSQSVQWLVSKAILENSISIPSALIVPVGLIFGGVVSLAYSFALSSVRMTPL